MSLRTFVALLWAAAVLASLNAATPVVLQVTNPYWFFSPYSTFSNGSGLMQANDVLPSSSRVIWTTPGSYCKAAFTGTSFSLTVDESNITSGANPLLAWSVDSGAWRSYTLVPPAEKTVVVASGLAAGNHSLILYLKTNDSYSDRWVSAPPTQAIQITGAQLDASAALIPLFGPALKNPKNYLFLGDSITEGVNTLTNAAITASTDGFQSWTHGVAAAFNAEYGNLGHGGLGWTRTALDGTPAQGTSYHSYFNLQTRLYSGKFSPVPDAVVVNMGTNDNTVNTVSLIQTFLYSIRANVNPATPIFMIVPFGQLQANNIISAVALTRDPDVFVINLGLAASYGLNAATGGPPTYASFDGVHPNAQANGWLAPWVAAQISHLVPQ